MEPEDTVDSIAAQDMGSGESTDTSVEETPSQGQFETPPAEGETDQAPAAEGAEPDQPSDDEDDDDDAADLDETLKADPRVRRLLNRGRKYRRQLAKHRPLAEVVHTLGGVEKLQEALAKAQSYDAIGRSPQVRRMLEGQGSPKPEEKPAAPTDWDDPEFPFDTADPAGKYLHSTFRRLHHSVRDLKAAHDQKVELLERRVQGLEGGIERERVAQTQTTWANEMERAAQELPDAAREAFRENIRSAYHYALANGIRITPDQTTAHYLGVFRKALGQVAGKSAAEVQRRAEQAKNMPGKAAFSGGQPAPARDKSKETLEDIFERDGIYVP